VVPRLRYVDGGYPDERYSDEDAYNDSAPATVTNIVQYLHEGTWALFSGVLATMPLTSDRPDDTRNSSVPRAQRLPVTED